ncbi:MAG TPA: rhodanese-like domain-containing protein [Chitinophagaceae bacterium]|jgi:rhodanese-related sulfurtransferase
MSFLSIFGIGNSRIREALRQGATIIDVRNANEFDQGKIRHSFNIPIDRLNINVERVRHMRKPIIICGNSDAESEQAIAILKTKGVVRDIHNGGSWTSLLKKVKSL